MCSVYCRHFLQAIEATGPLLATNRSQSMSGRRPARRASSSIGNTFASDSQRSFCIAASGASEPSSTRTVCRLRRSTSCSFASGPREGIFSGLMLFESPARPSARRPCNPCRKARSADSRTLCSSRSTSAGSVASASRPVADGAPPRWKCDSARWPARGASVVMALHFTYRPCSPGMAQAASKISCVTLLWNQSVRTSPRLGSSSHHLLTSARCSRAGRLVWVIASDSRSPPAYCPGSRIVAGGKFRCGRWYQ